jgi:hypothetical protein
LGGKTIERVYDYPTTAVFDAARKSVARLGYTVLHTDSAALTISFNTGRSMSSWAGQDLTATVLAEGPGSRVVVGGSLATRGSPFGGGSQIGSWAEKGRLSNKFLDEIPNHIILKYSGTTNSAEEGLSNTDDPIEQLRRLGELRDTGVITPDQFEAKRAELLGRI